MGEAQDSVSIHNKVAAELRGVITVGVAGLLTCQASLEINPACPQGAGTPVGAFELIGFIDFTLTVKKYGEIRTRLCEPLLDRGKRAK